jgi:hypothetical protein
MRFCNSGKVGKRLVGCPTVVQSAHGGWTRGWGVRVDSFFFWVPLLLLLLFVGINVPNL